MGNSESKKIGRLSAENDGYKTQLESAREDRAKSDAKRDIDEARLNERLCNVEAEKREIERQLIKIEWKKKDEEHQLKLEFEREKENLRNLSLERQISAQKELQTQFDIKMEECQRAANEEKKACEKKLDDLGARLMAEQEKRIDEAKKHGEKVEELHFKHEEKVDEMYAQAGELLQKHEEKVEELHHEYAEKVEEMHVEIGRLHREMAEKTEQHFREKDEICREKDSEIEEYRRENRDLERNVYGIQLAITGALSNIISVSDANQRADEFKKETILPMRESQTRKHCATDKLLGMVAKSNKKSGLFRGKAENHNDLYDEIDKETAVWRSLVDRAVDKIQNPAFSDTRRAKGQELLVIIRKNTADCATELAKCKGMKLHSVCLDEFVKCLNSIDEALDNFPPMVEETVASYIEGGLNRAKLTGTINPMAINSL